MRKGASTSIVGAVMTLVDCTGTICVSILLGPTTPDYCVMVGLQLGGTDNAIIGTWYMEICIVAACGRATRAFTLPCELMSLLSTTFTVGCLLILGSVHTAPQLQSTMSFPLRTNIIHKCNLSFPLNRPYYTLLSVYLVVSH